MKKKYANNKRELWSAAEITRFLKAAQEDEQGLIYSFILFTGVRQGEVLPLAWSDINFEERTITIRRNVSSFVNSDKQSMITRSISREIMLPLQLLAPLQEHKEKQQLLKEKFSEQYDSKLDLVFPKNDGGIQKISTVRKKLYRLMGKANVSQITLNDLRRMHAIMLFEARVSPLFISNQLGCKDIKSTLNYINQIPNRYKVKS